MRSDPIFYGLTESFHLRGMARAVCDVVGHGKHGKAVNLLLETFAQETHLGRYQDSTPVHAGVGVAQIDEIGFLDVQERTPLQVCRNIKERFGIDVKSVQYEMLAYSPLLSVIWCRLHYRLRPEVIPATLAERADYWKKFYNTHAGKGRAAEYIENAEQLNETWSCPCL